MPQEDPIALWQHLHGASVHFALALAIVSFLFDLGSKVLRKPEWRTVGFWSLVVAVVLSLPALFSGLWGQLGWFKVEPWPAESILLHRNLAIGGSAGLAVLLLWRGLTRDFGVRTAPTERKGDTVYLVYILLSFVTALVIGYTGYLGGYVARGY